MTIYYIIAAIPFITVIFAGYFFPYNSYRFRKFYIFLNFSFLLLISGFRSDEVGGDLTRYLPEFARITSVSFIEILEGFFVIGQREVGFALLEKTISIFTSNPYVYLFITSFISISIYLTAIYRNSHYVFLSVIIYVFLLYPGSFNIIRASIAVALCLSSFPFIIHRKFRKYCLVVFCAFLIQKTSLLFFPAYFLFNRKFSLSFIVFSIALALFLSFKLTGSGLALLAEKYMSMYHMSEDYLNDSSSGLSNLSYLQMFLTFYGVFCFYKKQLNTKENVFFIYMMLVATVIQFFSPVFTLLSRISNFYFCYVIYYIPYLIKYHNKQERLIFSLFSISIFAVLFFIGLEKNVHGIVPFKFNFE